MDKDKINNLVTERLGIDCCVDQFGPCWKLQSGVKSLELPDWVEGEGLNLIAAWMFENEYDMLCQVIPGGVVGWAEHDGETMSAVIYAETVGEAMCFVFLDLTDSKSQSHNGRNA